ncbi:MAG: hypothetical protein JRH13_06995 [Deltaproteobacteria bacterium]|nr:hypothetical protein [Deltaproteobacteria bacterium]MBW2129094.1 hypothetical protein [Deltaproteobacteria bacterium]
MEILLDIKIQRDTRSSMIVKASEEVRKALHGMTPPLDGERDIVRLKKYAGHQGHIKLIYEVVRDARTPKRDQTRSPYREKGIVMQVD